jgi:hypothetical protein
MNLCSNGCHARFVFDLYPERGSTHAAVFVGIGLEWNRVRSPKFVHPGCTVTTNRIRVGEMLLHEGAEACKKEGPKWAVFLSKHKFLSRFFSPNGVKSP